jgi:two-component system OmpR family response regulator
MTDVVVVCWPQEQAEVERLARLRIPRLLLVDPGCPPPVTDDVLEDWVRLPLDDREVKARLATLHRRAATLLDIPRLDRHGRLLFREHWISVTPIEERLLARLANRFNDVVPAAEVLDAGWPDRRPTANAVRVTMHRLRRRLRPMALELRRTGDGWLLHQHEALAVRRARTRPEAIAP